MDGLSFLGAAYLLVWLGIVAFLFSVTRRLKSLEKRMEDLRRSVDQGQVK